jgi:Ni,Fe-hydrogenase III component G
MVPKVKPKNKSQKDSSVLIEQALFEINQTYPEVRGRVKDTPQWSALSEIEQEINRAALEDDFEGLDKALRAYKQTALGIEHGETQGSLFHGFRNGQDEAKSDRE